MSRFSRATILILLVVAVVMVVAVKSQKKEMPAPSKSPPVVSSTKDVSKVKGAEGVESSATTPLPSAVEKKSTAKPEQSGVNKTAGSVRAPSAAPSEKEATQVQKNKTTTISPKPATQTRLPKLLDLGAEECIPCKMMMPILDQLKEEYKGKLEVEFVNLREHPQRGEELGIRFIPTQIILDRNGKEVFRHTGFWPKEEIVDKLKELGIL